jgi:ATP-dependent Lon protease
MASDAKVPLADEFEVRLFPLPKVVLFPGMILPLLVFEPRYRALVADALDSDRLVAVPRIEPGHDAEYWDCPPICRTFGVGRIIDDVKLPDGRYRIVVSGQARTQITEEVQQSPYRVARVRTLRETQPESTASLLALRANLLSQTGKLARTLGQEGERLIRFVNQAPTITQCTDLIAASLVADDAVRQQVLEAATVHSRLELLVGHLHGVALQLDTHEPSGDLN